MDNVAVSGLDLDGRLREVFAAGSDTDVVAEQRLLRHLGMASLLIVPFFAADRPIGILEFYHRKDRHWTAVDIEQGRGVALHLSAAWKRMSRGPAPSPESPVTTPSV